MGKVDGLIIPRSYNDYFSRGDPTAIRELVALYTDDELSTTSKLPVQNKIVKAAIDAKGAEVDAIEALIPSQATTQNQLADKNFVNSSVGTNTANYISDNGLPFTSVAALEAYSGTVTNNDYAFVTGTDSAGNTYYDRYKATVSGASVSWAKEYRLNNSSFTAAQWAAISSGITAAKVAQYDNANIPVGFIMPQYKKVSRTGWLYLDGRDTTGTADELQTVYPDLYEYLGNSNVLPDYREFGLVGAEENTTDVYNETTNPSGTIHEHDVYTEGEAKDDQMQKITGSLVAAAADNMHPTDGAFTDEKHGQSANRIGNNGDFVYHFKYTFNNSNVARTGYNSSGTLVGSDVTRGKRKAVYFYIKAL